MKLYELIKDIQYLQERAFPDIDLTDWDLVIDYPPQANGDEILRYRCLSLNTAEQIVTIEGFLGD